LMMISAMRLSAGESLSLSSCNVEKTSNSTPNTRLRPAILLTHDAVDLDLAFRGIKNCTRAPAKASLYWRLPLRQYGNA
jgi:hypothetical protein